MTPEFAELQRLLDAANSERVMTASLEMDYALMRKSTRALFIAAVEALPALLNAAAERDALTVAQPCVMRLGEVYDFAWCETHDRTFALGSSCDHAGLSHVNYLDDDGRKQRGRAVRAEMEMERIAAERDALAAKVERVRALLRDPLSVSDWDANAYVPMVKAADILRALGGPVSTAPATSNRLDALIRALEPTRDDNDGDDVLNRCRALIASWGALDEEAQP